MRFRIARFVAAIAFAVTMIAQSASALELDSIAKDESIPKDILGRQNLAIAETLAHLEAV